MIRFIPELYPRKGASISTTEQRSLQRLYTQRDDLKNDLVQLLVKADDSVEQKNYCWNL